jgi:hypothetical protein
LGESFFNDYTQLSHFHQYSNVIQFKFYEDDPEDIAVKFNLITRYFTGLNVDAIKYYINMLSGVNDKEVTVKINNLYCEFEETIEF